MVLVGDGTGTEAPGATGAGEPQAVPGLPGGLGTGVAVPLAGTGLVGVGVGMAGQAACAGLHVGTGTGVAVRPVGIGTGVAAHGDAVGTGTGMADEVIVGTGTGVADEAPAGLATGVAVPAVPAALGASVAGLLTVALAALPVPDTVPDAVPDAAWPEPGVAEQPARARPVAIPSTQPAATRAVLLSDRTCMLLEVVSLQ